MLFSLWGIWGEIFFLSSVQERYNSGGPKEINRPSFLNGRKSYFLGIILLEASKMLISLYSTRNCKPSHLETNRFYLQPRMVQQNQEDEFVIIGMPKTETGQYRIFHSFVRIRAKRDNQADQPIQMPQGEMPPFKSTSQVETDPLTRFCFLPITHTLASIGQSTIHITTPKAQQPLLPDWSSVQVSPRP